MNILGLVFSILKLSIQCWIHLNPLDQWLHQANNENSTINIFKEATVEHMFMDNAITWNKLNIKEIASECERNYFIIFVYIIKFFLPSSSSILYAFFLFFLPLMDIIGLYAFRKFSIIGIRICIQTHARKKEEMRWIWKEEMEL